MDLKVCLKYILSFILCIWQSESVYMMECEMESGKMQKSDVSFHCYPVSDVRGTLKENCQFFSCKQNETVDWKIINAKTGELQIQLRDLPKSCNFEWYNIELEVYNEEEPYNETLICKTANSPWRTHSRRILESSICSNCSLQSTGDCVQVYSAVFRYVYPGFYRMKITPYVNISSRQAQRSYWMYINDTLTYYVKKKFTDLNLNASLQYRSVKRELDLGIPFQKEDAPDEVKVDVKFSYDYIHLYGITYGNENSSSIKCQETGNLVLPSCKVQNVGLECKFYNMSPGFYSIHVYFIDDRCKKGTVWANQYSDPCYWIIKKNFTADGVVADAVIPNKEFPSPEIIYTIILIVILIGIIIVSVIVKRISWRRQRLGNGNIGKASENVRKTNSEQTYNFNNGNATRFNFGQLLTLTERPKPEVLLVYARETLPFMNLVACLRKVLQEICKCQVYDYFDPYFWNEVSEDSKEWVRTLIVERQVKVIIVASEVAAKQYHSLMGEFSASSYKFPHPFEHLFLYALRLLRDGFDEDSYKTRFVVTFDGLTETNHILDYFNPYTRFELPKHLIKLFEHLHDPDTTMHFDSSRLENRCEVREMRLQLQRLINSKLLEKRGIESNTSQNW